MSVAVITPFFQTPLPWLQQCLDSVARQTLPCTHFLVCDGDAPIGVEFSRELQILRLPKPHQDVGNAARAIGSVSAVCQGFDAIAYLDADNWYDPNHLRYLWDAHEKSKAAVCSSGRNLVDVDGNLLGPCPEVDGKNFVDTNCLFLTRAAFPMIAHWYLIPRAQVEVGDRVLWRHICEAKLKRAHVTNPTVWYRTRYEAHYRFFGKQAPPGAKPSVAVPAHDALPPPVVSLPDPLIVSGAPGVVG